MTETLSHERPSARQDGTAERLHTLVVHNFEFVWRLLRRCGLTSTDAEDASQQVFVVLAKKLSDLEPGKERSFLYGTALRLAWRQRRTLERRREELCDNVEQVESRAAAPDQMLQQQEARARLVKILKSLPAELGPVFILYEVEEMTLSEIACLLGLPRGTVASRLRRGRQALQKRFRNQAAVWERSA